MRYPDMLLAGTLSASPPTPGDYRSQVDEETWQAAKIRPEESVILYRLTPPVLPMVEQHFRRELLPGNETAGFLVTHAIPSVEGTRGTAGSVSVSTMSFPRSQESRLGNRSRTEALLKWISIVSLVGMTKRGMISN